MHQVPVQPAWFGLLRDFVKGRTLQCYNPSVQRSLPTLSTGSCAPALRPPSVWGPAPPALHPPSVWGPAPLALHPPSARPPVLSTTAAACPSTLLSPGHSQWGEFSLFSLLECLLPSLLFPPPNQGEPTSLRLTSHCCPTWAVSGRMAGVGAWEPQKN